jgi:PAS domain S-box-containing protein
MRKILVIDDLKMNILLIQEIMSKFCPEVFVLKSLRGKEGIKIAKKENPDAILLDVMMPEMDGYEVCVKLKSDPLTAHIPIILVSAIVKDSESIIKGLNLGADAFLTKPIHAEELAAQIRVVLRIRNAEDLLRKESEKYKIMTKTLPDAVLTVNLNHYITYSTDQASNLFGYKNSFGLLDKDIFTLFSDKNKAEARVSLDEISKKKIVKDLRFRFVKNNKSEFYGELSGALIFNENSKPDEIVIVVRDISDRQNAEYKIHAYQSKLKTMNSMLTLAEENEKKLIAEAMHDGMGQTLALTKIKLSSLFKETRMTKVQRVIEESVLLIEDVIQETKSLTYDLSPPILYELGLQAAIKWKLLEIQKKHKIETVLITELEDQLFSNNANILIYRIISELLNNIVKHAHAKKIEINLFKDLGGIIIAVKDNGVGFDVNLESHVNNNGFGLFSIHERLESIHGLMKIDSASDKGTNVEIKIPIAKTEK